MKQKRKAISTVINTISGRKIRILKAEVADVQEQYTLGGGIDVVIIMKSGWQYIVNATKQEIENKVLN